MNKGAVMKNSFKMLMVLVILVSSFNSTSAFDDKEDKKLKANYSIYQDKSSQVVNLIYQPTSKIVKIRIYDPNGNMIMRDVIRNKEVSDEVFVRPYNFQALRAGNYIFEIREDDKVLHHLVEYRKSSANKTNRSPIAIVALENGKYQLLVKESVNPVEVNIYSVQNRLIYNEQIDQKESFSKVFDLSQVEVEFCTFKVKIGGQEYTRRIRM